jgi:SpoIVB peptidase S55
VSRRRGGLVSLALPLALGLLGAAAGVARAADPILPLDQVRPGMVGEARTVVRGTAITTFPVEVVDVQRTADAPGGALILIRAEGPLIASTGGIAEGMSGSPVYVTGPDGVSRVMGAVSYGTGDADNVLGGVTPIEQMLAPGRGRLANEAPPPSVVERPLRVVADRAAATRAQARTGGSLALYPLQRWMVAGASRSLVTPLADDLARSGVALTSIGGRQPRPPQPLVPGASLTALLAAGDVVIGAVGTVTYVDGDRVYGFGHPFLDTGRSRFLMGDGYVYETIPNPEDGSSYKLAEPGTLHGAIVGDRADGIIGRQGPTGAIRLLSTATDLARGTQSTIHVQVAPDARTVPQIGDLLQGEPAIRVRDGIGGGTLTLRITALSPVLRRPVVYRNMYAAAGDVLSVSMGALARVGSVLLGNGVREVPISVIRVDQVLEPDVKAARIVAGRVTPRRARPGQRVTLSLLIQPWRASRRTVRLPITVPSDLTPGEHRLQIVPNAPEGFDAAPPDLSDAIGSSTEARSARSFTDRVDELAAKLPGGRLPRLVEALRRATRDRHDAVRVLGPGQDPADPTLGRVVGMPDVIYGGRALPTITIVRRR